MRAKSLSFYDRQQMSFFGTSFVKIEVLILKEILKPS